MHLKTAILALLLLTCATARGQWPEFPEFVADTNRVQDHLLFYGIPIQGTLKEFSRHLEDSGYRRDKSIRLKDYAFFTGPVEDEAKATLTAMTTQGTDTVWTVQVTFRPQTDWEYLSWQYRKIKDEFTERYGTPVSSEYFMPPYEDGDKLEIHAVQRGKCRFTSIFTTLEGTVSVEIAGEGQGGAVKLTWQDERGYRIWYSARVNDELKKLFNTR